MLAALRSRIDGVDEALRGLLCSDTLLLLSQMVGYVAVPWWIAQQGGACDLALYGVVCALAMLVSFPLLAPWSERVPKRAQMTRGIPVLALCALLFALLAGSGRYDSRLIVAIGVVSVVANAFVESASSSISPELVPAVRLPDALRWRKTAATIGRLLGPLLAGAALTLAGTAATLWLCAALLAAAAIAVRRIPVGSEAQPADDAAPARWWPDLKAGLAAKWGVPLERGWTLVNFLVWIFIGPAIAMLVPLKVQALGLSGAWLGACEASLSIGMLLGSLGASDSLVRRFGRFPVRVAAAMAEGVLLAAVGHTQSAWLLVLGFAGVGFANTSMVLVGATHRALAIPQAFRVRMGSVNVVSTQIANAIGPAIAGVALLHWPLGEVYVAFGLTGAMLASGFALVPRAREFFSLSHEDVTDWYQRQYPAAFRARPHAARSAGSRSGSARRPAP